MKLWTLTMYLLARWEVSGAVRGNYLAQSKDSEDMLPPHLVPSVAGNGTGDRVLAEIDQDGFVFPIEPTDAPIFQAQRATMMPRKDHRVQIILVGGSVRIRKMALRKTCGGVMDRILEFLQWDFYIEAAALLRLRTLAEVPMIRHIDPALGIIEMNYVWGSDLRQIFSDNGSHIDYEAVTRRLCKLAAYSNCELSRQLTTLLYAVIDRGVIPRDVHAANVIVARRSGRLYLVDFNLVHLCPVPGWRAHSRHITSLLSLEPDASGKT